MYPARSNPCEIKRPMIPDTAARCEYFAESFRKAASEARALSAAHAEIAKKGVPHSFLRCDASLPNREPVVPSRGDIRETPGYRRPGQA